LFLIAHAILLFVGDNHTGVIIGTVIGTVFAIVVMIVLVVIIVLRIKKKNSKKDTGRQDSSNECSEATTTMRLFIFMHFTGLHKYGRK